MKFKYNLLILEKEDFSKPAIALLQKKFNVRKLPKNNLLQNKYIQSSHIIFIRLKYNDIINVRDLLDAFGVYYIEATGEADEMCAKLVIKKYAYACLSEDMDLFLPLEQKEAIEVPTVLASFWYLQKQKVLLLTVTQRLMVCRQQI